MANPARFKVDHRLAPTGYLMLASGNLTPFQELKQHGQRIKSKLLLTFGRLAVGPSARMIIELNIKHYGRLLKVEADPARRQTIAKLVAEEREKLATLLKQEEKGR